MLCQTLAINDHRESSIIGTVCNWCAETSPNSMRSIHIKPSLVANQKRQKPCKAFPRRDATSESRKQSFTIIVLVGGTFVVQILQKP